MDQNRIQPVILPQTGYILPQPSFNIVSPLSSGTSTYAHQPLYPRTVHFPLSYAGYSDPRANEMNLTYSPVQSVFSLNPSSVEVMEKDYQIVTYEELEKLLPEPKPTGRVELGLLPNGCAYAPKTASRENYLLFASKYSYILYFTHHYFSRENLCRDQTFLNMLVDRLILPIEKLIKAPRLAALNTTHEEVEQALLGSKIVCVEDMNAGMRGVRRIDGYPGLSMNPDTSTHMQPDSGISAFDTSQNLTSLMASFSIQPPCFADERIAGNPQPVVVMRSPGSEKLRPDTFMNRPGHGSLEMNKEASQTSALIQNSVSTVPGSQNQLPVPILLPICDTDNSSSGQFEYINAPGYSMSSCRDMTSWALQQSSKQYNAYPRIAQFLVPHSANQLGSVGQYKGQSSALNFHSGTTMTGADNARSGEIRNVTVLSVPRQTHLPNYLIRQTANVTESYSASLPVPRTSNTNQPLNFAVAAALASLGANTSSSVNQQQRAHQPHYFSNELLTNSSNISQIGVNSQRPSNPLLDHFHAVAAMSTVAQHHRLSPVYFPNSINQTNPFNMSPPVPLPMYYATPQLPLQAPLQRNPFQRLQQNALYPMQTYTHQSIHNVGSHEPSEIMKSDSKRGLQVSNLTQHTNNFIYPLLLQPPVHIQQNKSPTTNLNVTGLRIHYSSQSTKGSFNPVEIAPVPITFAVINTNGNISNTDTSVSKGISTSSTYSESKISFPITSATVTDLTGNASFKIENHSSDSGAAVSLAAVSSAENPGCTITSDNHADKTLKPIDKATSPGSVHDSEDSVSSGIGDMTATSTGDNDSRNNSSCTLTEVTHNPNCGYLRNKCLTQVKEKTTGT